jgi:hypothetical protein
MLDSKDETPQSARIELSEEIAGGPVGAVVGSISGAAVGNAMTGPRYPYAYYHRHPHRKGELAGGVYR